MSGSLKEEIEIRQSVFKAEAEQRHKELMRDFEALVQSGIIDRDKAAKYFEIRKKSFDEAQVRPSIDVKDREKELVKAQEKMLLDQRWMTTMSNMGNDKWLPAIMVAEDFQTWANTWNSKPDPEPVGFDAGANENPFKVPGVNVLKVTLGAMGGYTTDPVMAQAWAGAIWRFRIPGKHIPYGMIEIYPHLEIHGMGDVLAYLSSGFQPKGYEAWAEIKASIRTSQLPPAYSPTKWIPLTIFDEKAPPNKTTTGPYQKPILKPGFWTIDCSESQKLKVPLKVQGGIDVLVEVMIELRCDVTGGLTIARLYFDGTNDYISVPKIATRIVSSYLPPVMALLPALYEQYPWPTPIPPELIKELKKKI